MARQQRIFYACQAVAITPKGKGTVATANVIKGAQSVGMSTTFSLDQVFEMGQVAIYDNIEEVADVEVTVEKVIDGELLIFALASNNQCKSDLVAASKERCDVYVAIYDDGTSNATGAPRSVCYNSGMYISSVSYNYSVDGSATESVTMVGNDRFWNAEQAGLVVHQPSGLYGTPTTGFTGSDTPVSGVVRRTDVLLGGSPGANGDSTIPAEVDLQKGDDPVATNSNRHIQSISVSTDFGQEQIQELGRFGPFTRYATFPIEVTCEFEVSAVSGDLISVSGNSTNLQDRQIVIRDSAGTVLDLGSQNKLSSISYSGGDTGGGNSTVTYSYSNFNVLTVDGGGSAAS